MKRELSVRLAVGVAAVAGLAAGVSGPAQATDYAYSTTVNASDFQCTGTGEVVCVAWGQNFTNPITAQAGDTFHINANFGAGGVHVPGSNVSNSIGVFLIDQGTAPVTFGPDVSNGTVTLFNETPKGLPTPEGSTTPLTIATNRGYIAGADYGIEVPGYGVPNDGFSVSGFEADLDIVTGDPTPLFGYAVLYSYGIPPLKTLDLQGGAASSPADLPNGNIGEVGSSISGGRPTDDYYDFNWTGGLFQATAQVTGVSDPRATFDYELFSPDRSTDINLELDAANNWQAELGAVLAQGTYIIGLATSSPYDPQYQITFNTPVRGGLAGFVPEPGTWAMLLLGMAGAGAALRRSRRASASAAG